MGAIRKRAFKDLTGQVFSKLTVLYHDTSKVDTIYFVCQCACGNMKSIRSHSLTHGISKSCGCLELDRLKLEAYKKRAALIGEVFGRLTVIELSDRRTKSGGLYWNCQCECGNLYSVPGSRLAHSRATNMILSCGCRNKELFIERAKKRTEQYRISKGNLPEEPLSPRRTAISFKYEASGLKQEILIRDNYTCQLCNKVGGTMHVHHLVPVNEDPSLLEQPSNLVSLCKECHTRKVHPDGNLWKIDSDLTLLLQERVNNSIEPKGLV